MNQDSTINGSPPAEHSLRLSREKAFFLYWSALERGDLEVCDRVWRGAAHDPELQAIILAAHQADNAEYDVALAESAHEVQQVLSSALSTPVLDAPLNAVVEELELPPLTVAHVAAQMQAETARYERRATPDESQVLGKLSQLGAPVPEKLSLRAAGRFLESLGVTASERTQKAFRETAFFMWMGRQQNLTHMAATRRTHLSHAGQQGVTAKGVELNPTSFYGDAERATPDFAPFIEALYAVAEESLPTLSCPIVPLSALARGEDRDCIELPQLTAQVAFAYLRQRGSLSHHSFGNSPELPATSDKALSGFVWASVARSVIFVREEESVARRRFSAAHELGHFVLHWPREREQALLRGQIEGPEFIDSLEPQSEESEPGDIKTDERHAADLAFMQREREADAFAAELLMPPLLVRQLAECIGPRRDSDIIARLAVDMLVSRAAMRWRLRTLGLLREE